MKPTAHFSAECLAAYSAGSLPAGLSLLVASHLDFCGPCRERTERLDTLGGALMADGPSVEPDAGCLANCLAQIDVAERPACCDACLPEALRARLGGGLADLSWEPVADGVRAHRLPGFGREAVRLITAEPGRRIHDAPATTTAMLVLTGRLRGRTRVYAPGDVALLPAGVDGATESVGAEPCTCLVADRCRD